MVVGQPPLVKVRPIAPVATEEAQKTTYANTIKPNQSQSKYKHNLLKQLAYLQGEP